MLSRIMPSPSLLVALGLAALPATAMAQTVVTHAAVYTAKTMSELMADTKAPRTNMPMVSEAQIPMAAMLRNNSLPTGAYALVPGVVGSSSDGVHREVVVDKEIAPQASGNLAVQAIAPYTTARASASVLGATPTAAAVGVTSFPWRATGKLFFKSGADTFVCSASLIGPGLLLTAAHCVFEYGANAASGFHTNYVFIPAQNTAGGTPPYGTWTTLAESIAPAYYSGTDSCYQKGVSCSNDVAVLILQPDANGRLPGSLLGFYGYAWDGYSFVKSFGDAALASITQLGYPVALDGGMMMERNDGIGSYWSPDGETQQVLLGTALTGGASGGPWLVNFGARPTVAASASLGNAASSQVVMAVTGWGFTKAGQNTQGASWFGRNKQFPKTSYVDSHGVDRGAGNIGALVAAACSASFASC